MPDLKQLDLGFGGVRRQYEGVELSGYYGIDNSDCSYIGNDVRHNVGYAPLPFPDDFFDVVTAYDFLEHIPMQIIREDGSFKPIMRDLFNEIYRVMKHGALFYSQTPCYPSRTVFQDPTHVAFWTEETPHYFSGNYYGFHDQYGHISRFAKDFAKTHVENDHLCLYLKAIKNLPKDHPYEVVYA